MKIFAISSIILFILVKIWNHLKYVHKLRMNRFVFFHEMNLIQHNVFTVYFLIISFVKCFFYEIGYRYLLLECSLFPSLAKNKINTHYYIEDIDKYENVKTLKGFRSKGVEKNTKITKNIFSDYFLVYVNPKVIKVLDQNVDLCLFCLYVSPLSYSLINIVDSPSYEETVKNLYKKKKMLSLMEVVA